MSKLIEMNNYSFKLKQIITNTKLKINSQKSPKILQTTILESMFTPADNTMPLKKHLPKTSFRSTWMLQQSI